MMKAVNDRRGFTILETLIAIAIFITVIAGFLAFYFNCLFLNENNRHLTIANSHAQFVMESVKGTTFLNIASGNWDAAAISAKGLTLLPEETIAITVAGTDPKDVSVTVSWKDQGTRDRSLALRTLIANP